VHWKLPERAFNLFWKGRIAMEPTDAMQWILCVCQPYLRRSQAKTLSVLVISALSIVRVTLAELGRCLAQARQGRAKHAIKRVDRFVGNPRIEPAEAMRGPVQWLAQPRRRLLVNMDWVDIRNLHCIVLAARIRGRALPLLWAAYRQEELFRSQNNIEYGLLHLLRTMVPASTEVVIVADRGFGRAQMGRVCQELGFFYIVRIEPNVWIRHPKFTGKLLYLGVRPGREIVLRDATDRKDACGQQHVVVYWDADQNEPWFLMTNLPRLHARRLACIYGRRMTIEEYFRDSKSLRNGMALRLNLIRDPRRLERLMLVLALAYWLLVALGLHCLKVYPPATWCSNNRSHECSLFTIGRWMLHADPKRLVPLLRDLRREVLSQKWG